MVQLLPRGSNTLQTVEEVLLILSATVSFMGCAFLFSTWKSFSTPNYLSRRIIVSLGLAGLITAFGFALSIFVDGSEETYKRHESLCYLQAFTLQYFYLASYLWTACFAFHLYQIIVKRQVNEYPEQFLWLYRLIGWGLPGIVLIYLVERQLTGHLGVGSADRRWCWISVHATNISEKGSQETSIEWRRDGAWQQFFLFYIPIGCVFMFNASIYYLILRFLAMDPMAARFKRKVLLYLVIFFLCSIWGAINRLVQFFRADHQTNKFLSVMECVCDPLQPLLNALAYGTNKRSLDAYKERFCSSWFYASLPSSDEEESGIDDSPLLSSTDDDQPSDSIDIAFGPYFGLGSNKKTRSQSRLR